MVKVRIRPDGQDRSWVGLVDPPASSAAGGVTFWVALAVGLAMAGALVAALLSQ